MIRTILLAFMMGHLSLSVRAADAEPKKEDSAPSFDLTFPGGTPQNLVIAIEEASGSKLNVLISAELADVKLPPMELRSVSAKSVFDSLSILSPDLMRWIPNGNVWVLSRRPDSRKTQAFYVGHLLKKFKIDDITTAVQTTWQLGGKDAKAELKYHQDTQLLIALGYPEQLSTAAEVLAQLKLAIEPVRIEPEKTDDTKSVENKKGKPTVQP
jgi:hypothetical protein